MPASRSPFRSITSVSILMFLFLLLALSAGLPAQSISPDVNPWMPELFAGLPHVRDLAIAPDARDCYVSVQSYRKEFAVILRMEWNGTVWGQMDVAPFSGQYIDIEPAFSPDGKRLYFASTRPVHPDSGGPKDYDIWFVERAAPGKAWSDPQRLPSPVNSAKNEFYPSVASNGNIYFTRTAGEQGQQEDIFVSRWEGSSYAEPEALSDAVNSKRWEFNAYVSPDESYLIFTSFGRPDDLGGGDLYMSVRDEDGVWQPARHLGDGVNSNRIDYCPFVDVRTGLLYFTSERSAMPASFDAPLDLPRLREAFARAPMGNGRIYFVPFRAVGD